jgi:hypothetical protein
MKNYKYFASIISMVTSFYIVSAWMLFAQTLSDESRVSMEVKNEALGVVLDEISQETGYSFSIDKARKDHPVKASLHNVPLNLALKRILGTLNHAIVYESDTQIRIEIYGKPAARSAGASAPPYELSNPPVEEPPEPEQLEEQPVEEKQQSETSQEAIEQEKTESNTNDQNQENRPKVNSE